MKRILVLLAGLALILSACAQTTKPIIFTKPEKGTFEAPTGNVTSPDSASTWTQNNIKMIRSDQTESIKNKTKIYQDSLQIDGLKNDAVEAKINQLISAKIQELSKYAEFKNLSVSQGFYAKFPKDTSSVKSIQISIDEFFNFNNLLSLRFFVSVTISDKLPENNYRDFYIADAMTIDLNTGNAIHLSDLFINDFDFEKTLNTAILIDASSKTDEGEDEYDMSYIYRGGFSGMRNDVGFLLSYNGLNLIFDATYHEFDNGFSSTIVEIPFSSLKDGLAFGQRFLSKESLFTDPKITRQGNHLNISDVAISNYTLNGIPVTSTISVNNQIKDDWLAMTKRLVIEDKKTLEIIANAKVAYINYELYAAPVGQYMRISRRFSSGTIDFSDRENTEIAYLVRADGSILTLKDLFVPGYDYETPIKKALTQFLETEYMPDDKGKPSVDEAYNSLNLYLGYGYFGLYNTAPQPPALIDGQIDISFSIDSFKDYINEEALLK